MKRDVKKDVPRYSDSERVGRFFTSESNRIDTLTAISTNGTVLTDFDYDGVGTGFVPFIGKLDDMIKGENPTGITRTIMDIGK